MHVQKTNCHPQIAETDKKRKHLDACLNQRRHFTPFVVSCEGLHGKEASIFMKWLSERLADKWKCPCSSTSSLLRTHFAVSLVCSKNRYLRGVRVSPNKISHPCDWEDGASLHFFSALE